MPEFGGPGTSWQNRQDQSPEECQLLRANLPGADEVCAAKTGGEFKRLNKLPALQTLPERGVIGPPRNLLRKNLSSEALRARDSIVFASGRSFRAEFVTNSTSS